MEVCDRVGATTTGPKVPFMLNAYFFLFMFLILIPVPYRYLYYTGMLPLRGIRRHGCRMQIFISLSEDVVAVCRSLSVYF
jgi:hypothetical protein